MNSTPLDRRRIGRWLAVWAVMLFLLILIGAATRLTESGLSITEWKPVSGVVPPMSDSAWVEAFLKYQQIPQYREMNARMTIVEFRTIYWWEFLHRFWARFVGVIFVVPLLWFGFRKRIPKTLVPRLTVLAVLLALQGAMGWYMVASGLTERVNVSQYRLAAHLFLALVIYLRAVALADELMLGKLHGPGSAEPPKRTQRRKIDTLQVLFIVVFVTVMSGAVVAGLRAGKIYNEFPLMGGRVIPMGWGSLRPFWRDLFENPAAAQFNHRLLAMVTLLAVFRAFWRVRNREGERLKQLMRVVLAAALLQVALGITVLLLSVPVLMGVAHQAGALLLLTALTLALCEASRERGRRHEPA